MLFGRLIRLVLGIYILFNAMTNALTRTEALYICHNFSTSRFIRKTRQSALLLVASTTMKYWYNLFIVINMDTYV